MSPRVTTRPVPAAAHAALLAGGLHPVLARIYAARGVADAAELAAELPGLVPPERLRHADAAALLLADAIAAGRRLVIVADYDSDGATACAVGVKALAAMGARVDYVVPNRFEYGYGLTPEIVRLAVAEKSPELLITVDNGIASVDGVAEAARLGVPVLVTDHHLPGAALPAAACIVNPNQAGCGFPSKALAGVGVMFYVMLALRAELRRRGAFADGRGPNLAALLDLVALGTVADVVPLDANNRILVRQGLARIRAGKACPGVAALLGVAGRDPARAATYDLAFALGPRLNAAGRLTHMALGIECLLAADPITALPLARQLDQLNRERRDIETGMQEEALAALENARVGDGWSLALYDPGWHQGVIGILAGRLRDRYHRPAFAFARGPDGLLKGSGRAIRGLHLRDALDLVDKRQPGLLVRFGGHAAAAGLSLAEADFPRFAAAFETVSRELLNEAQLTRLIETDGELPAAQADMALARLLSDEAWGQGFPEPCFRDRFRVESQRLVGEKHLKLRLARDGRRFEAMAFNRPGPLPDAVDLVYRLAVDEWNGAQTLRLTVEHWEAA